MSGKTTSGEPHSPRKRDAEATRNALLAAARAEFQRAGYGGASTRRIASDARCNVALINRYFGSKAHLFEAVMETCIDLTPLAGLSRDEIAPALADIALSKGDPPEAFDPLVVAIRSSGAEEVRDAIRDHLGDPMVAELAGLIGGTNARQKAGVILSLISGIYIGRVSIGARALSQDHDAEIRDMVAKAICAILSPEDDDAKTG